VATPTQNHKLQATSYKLFFAMKKRFLLRLDPKLYDALAKWAADDLRSVNAQIEYLLTQAAKQAGRLGGEEEEGEKGNAQERENV